MKPIIMGAESVQAILDGRKTQTRRVVNKRALERFRFSPSGELLGSFNESHPEWEVYPTVDDAPYRVGDRLWVREGYTACWGGAIGELAHKTVTKAKVRQIGGGYAEASKEQPITVFYRANGEGKKLNHLKWKSPLFMPRWASRITLEITDIRVDRLQDISEEDADAELFGGYEPRSIVPEIFNDDDSYKTIPECFGKFWDYLNAKRGYPWESNPWVWCIGFKRVHDQKEDV